MLKILNFTLHQQSEEVKHFLEEELGCEVYITSSFAPEIPPRASMEIVERKVEESVPKIIGTDYIKTAPSRRTSTLQADKTGDMYSRSYQHRHPPIDMARRDDPDGVEAIARLFEEGGQYRSQAKKNPDDIARLIRGQVYDLAIVGGLTSAMVAFIQQTGVPVIEIGTERLRDENDRFIFEPKSVRFIRGSMDDLEIPVDNDESESDESLVCPDCGEELTPQQNEGDMMKVWCECGFSKSGTIQDLHMICRRG